MKIYTLFGRTYTVRKMGSGFFGTYYNIQIDPPLRVEFDPVLVAFKLLAVGIIAALAAHVLW